MWNVDLISLSWRFALFLFALISGCWFPPPFFPVLPTRVLLFRCSRGGGPYLMLQCYLFLYLLCISCPMDFQCPIKAVTINQSINDDQCHGEHASTVISHPR